MTNPTQLPDDIKDLIIFLKFVSNNIREQKSANAFKLDSLCKNTFNLNPKILDILFQNLIIVKEQKGGQVYYQWGKVEPNPLMAQAISNKLDEIIKKEKEELIKRKQQETEQYEEESELFANDDDDIEGNNFSVELLRGKRRKWKDEEIKYIKERMNQPVESLALHLKRSIKSVKMMLYKLKKGLRKESEINHKKFWKHNEIEFILTNIDMPTDWLCEQLKRTRSGILSMIYRITDGDLKSLAIKRGITIEKKQYANNFKRWTDDEIKHITVNINSDFDSLVEKMQRSPASVNQIIENIKEGKYNHIIGEELARKVNSNSNETESDVDAEQEILSSELDVDLNLPELNGQIIENENEEEGDTAQNLNNPYTDDELIFIALNKNQSPEWFKDKIHRSRYSVRKKLNELDRHLPLLKGKTEEQLSAILNKYLRPESVKPIMNEIPLVEEPKNEQNTEEIIEDIKTEQRITVTMEQPVLNNEKTGKFKRQNKEWDNVEIEMLMEYMEAPMPQLVSVLERSEKAIGAMIWRLKNDNGDLNHIYLEYLNSHPEKQIVKKQDTVMDNDEEKLNSNSELKFRIKEIVQKGGAIFHFPQVLLYEEKTKGWWIFKKTFKVDKWFGLEEEEGEIFPVDENMGASFPHKSMAIKLCKKYQERVKKEHDSQVKEVIYDESIRI
jgi:hypothetical protein